MKRFAGIVLAVGIIAAIGIGAFAHGGGRGWGGYGGHMMGGWGAQGGGYGYCRGYGAGQRGGWGWNAPGESGTVPQALTEEQLKASVQAYVDQYLPGYAIESIEQDQWRPMHSVTLKGENDAELQLFVNSFSGVVMHVFGTPVESTSETP